MAADNRGGPQEHCLPTIVLAICDEAHRTAGARTAGPLNTARDQMGRNPFFVEIPVTTSKPTSYGMGARVGIEPTNKGFADLHP